MKPITLEWIEKAEHDFLAAKREYSARNNPLYDISCFHSQQCVEKYLKGYLEENGIAFIKTHDLVVLLSLILPIQPSWNRFLPDMALLSGFAIAFRYPGMKANKTMAK